MNYEPYTHGLCNLKLRVWHDTSGEVVDCYTVVILSWPTTKGCYTMLGMDSAGGKYFSQFGEGIEGDHLGKLVRWDDLDDRTRQHIAARLAND